MRTNQRNRRTTSSKKTVRRSAKKTVTRNSQPKNKRATSRRSSSVSLENGIKIVKYAIKHKLSLSEASRQNGKGKNYVSDIKARLEENRKSGNISKNLFDIFRSVSKQYEKTVR